MKRNQFNKVQRFVDTENVQELFLTKQEIMALIAILSSYGEKLNPLTEGLILHYLPMNQRVESNLLKGVYISRLSTLLHVEEAPIRQTTVPINIDDEMERVAKWVEICDS